MLKWTFFYTKVYIFTCDKILPRVSKKTDDLVLSDPERRDAKGEIFHMDPVHYTSNV